MGDIMECLESTLLTEEQLKAREAKDTGLYYGGFNHPIMEINGNEYITEKRDNGDRFIICQYINITKHERKGT